MDFSRVALCPDDEAFLDRTRAFLAEHVTAEVHRRDREFGENFNEQVHVALGEAGYLAADFKPESEGGFSPVRRRIFELEIARALTPWYHWGTTSSVARLVQRFGAPELVGRVLPGVLSGEIRLCLGYTEPEGGSYTVSFVPACNLHDAGYGGQTVADVINGGIVDTHAW